VRKAGSWLIFVSIVILISTASAQTDWVSLDNVVINLGTTDEVGVGQILRVDVTVSSYGAPQDVNITVGVDIYNSSGYVTSFTNQTDTLPQDSNKTYTFNATVLLSTGYYTARAFVVYEQNGTNRTLTRNSSFKVVKLEAVSLGMEHLDLAPGETATFLQYINNTGTVPANATVKVWIEYDDPSTSTSPDRLMATEPPVTQRIENNTLKTVKVLWAVPSDLNECKYTNSSRYKVYSSWKYGTSYFTTANNLKQLNLSYVEVDTKNYGGYLHSGLTQAEAAPGGEISGGVELLNRGYYSVVIHEVRAWVEDSSGNRVAELSPTDLSLSISGNAYQNVVLPGHNSTCSGISTNDTLAHQGSKSFPFRGTLPSSLSLNESYKVVFAVDYGVPRDRLLGNPWNILHNYSFEIVKAEVSGLASGRGEVAPGVSQDINVTVKNVGSNTIDSASLVVEIRDPANSEVKNFSETLQNLAGGKSVTQTYTWSIPSNIALGTYTVNARVHYATGVYHSRSAIFKVVRLSVLNISSAPVAPYESTNVTVKMQNQGPTNATLELLGVKLKANRTVDLGKVTNRVIANGTTSSFNFSYYFNPEGMSNGTFDLEANITYGGLSYTKLANITLLPVGIRSFSLPSYAITNTSFNTTVVLHNIGAGNVSVSLNLTVNGSTYSTATVVVPANSTLPLDLQVNLTSSGSYTIALYANYSSLPGRLSRSGSLVVYDTGAELSISSGDITLSPASPRQGDTVTISAKVRNTGSVAANNVTVEFLLDSASYANKTVSIAANSSTTVDFTWSSAASGAHTVTIRVDPQNAFAERNESDNAASVAVSVAAAVAKAALPAGGAPRVESPFREGINIVTPSALLQSVREKRLESKRFYSAAEPLLPALAALGYNPAPESIEKRLRVEPLEGDVYSLAAELALEKYIYLTYPYTVIIARGDIPVDAIAAIAYARSNRIPVLLTKPGELPGATLSAIEKFKPRRIIIVGGERAVSRSVEERLAEIAKVERIAGKTRYETAVKLAELSKNYDTIVVTSGEKPSRDAVFLASAYRAPVVYVREDSIPGVTADFISEHRVTPTFRPVKLLLVGVNASLHEQLRGLVLSPHLSGELVVRVTNADDDRLYVEVWVGSLSKGEFIAPGESLTYRPFRLRPGDYTVRLRWLDPDRIDFSHLEARVEVEPGERTELALKVPRITE